MRSIILYVPVLHKGYLELLSKYNRKVNNLYLLSDDLVAKFSKFREIRALPAHKVKKLIGGLEYSFGVRILTKKSIKNIRPSEIITAQDTISNKFVEKYFPKTKVNLETIFLRWDEEKVKSPTPPHYDAESTKEFDQQMLREARKISESSSDWWRRVGVVVVKKEKIIVKAYNEYLPSENAPYIDGNPRDFIKAGTLGFLATSVHAEQAAISKASKLGISLKGTDLYLNSYPCPTCANLMGFAGIKRCFFSGGNAYLNVEEVVKAMGIKTILVKEK